MNELRFAPGDEHGLYSASCDGTLRLWDLRAPQPNIHTFNTGGKEVWCASMNLDSTFIAGGVSSALRTWDLRTRKAYRSYVDAHTDDVTCVRAHPHIASVFVTGSEDGLMCAINNASGDIDDAIESVINVNCAIARVGFVGPLSQQVYAVTNLRGLQLWTIYIIYINVHIYIYIHTYIYIMCVCAGLCCHERAWLAVMGLWF